MGVECSKLGRGSASWHPYGATARGDDDVELPAIGEDERHLVGERVHRIPQISVLLRLRAAAGRSPGVANVNKRSRATVFLIIGTLREVNEAVRVVRCHLPDASEGDDDRLIGGVAHGVELLQTGYLFEQLGFGVVSKSPE